MTDQELLRTYACSSEEAPLRALVGRHQQSLVRFMANLLEDPVAAQDVVQETFVEVAHHPARYAGGASCRNGLLRTARNLGLRRLRLAHGVAGHRGGAGPEERRDPKPGAEGIAGPLCGLSPHSREVLLLKILEDKSYRDIAEITGLSLTRVGCLLHRALQEATQKMRPSTETRS